MLTCGVGSVSLTSFGDEVANVFVARLPPVPFWDVASSASAVSLSSPDGIRLALSYTLGEMESLASNLFCSAETKALASSTGEVDCSALS